MYLTHFRYKIIAFICFTRIYLHNMFMKRILCSSFDQNLNEMKSKNFSKQHTFTEHLYTHMWGQLHFHLACLLLRKTKREQGSWNEAGRLCSPLLLTALHVAPLENRLRIQLEDDGFKNQFNIWAIEAAYRCCQAGT